MSAKASTEIQAASRGGSEYQLNYSIEPANSLNDATVAEMFALYADFYEDTTADLFRKDLTDKQTVIMLRDTKGVLRGFSTSVTTDHLFEGKRVRAFYSGDTVVDRHNWGQQALWRAWLRLTGSIKKSDPETPLYWFLVVNGHRSYRCLRVFFKVFFPAFDRTAPAREKKLMDVLGRGRFGEAYDSERGVVSFVSAHEHLKSAWTEIPQKDRDKPDVTFFLSRNPGYIKGDLLVCLTEFTVDNLKPFARRLFEEGKIEPTSRP